MRAVSPTISGYDSTVDSTASNSRSSKSISRLSVRRASTDVNLLIVDARDALREKEQQLRSTSAAR